MADDPTPTSTPDPAPALGGGSASWRDTLPDDLKAAPELQKYASIAELAKGHLNQSKLVGAKPQGLVPPGDKATPEEKTAYDAALRKTLGVPEQPTGYTIKRPDVVLDGGWDTAAEATFLGAMHKVGAPPAVVQAAIDFYGQYERAKLEQATAEAQRVGTQLRQEWGADYDARLGRANRAVLEFGGKELDEAFTTVGHTLNAAGRHPLLVRAWANVGQALVEHGAMTGEGLPTMGADEAKARAATLRNELKTMDEAHPRRAELVEEIINVTRAAGRR